MKWIIQGEILAQVSPDDWKLQTRQKELTEGMTIVAIEEWIKNSKVDENSIKLIPLH